MRFGIIFTFVLVATSQTVVAQDLYKELSKLDPNSVTEVVDGYGKKHADLLVAVHTAKLAELEKSGVQIIRGDVTLTVAAPTKIAFAWPVAAGQKLSDKSLLAREPYVMTLYPTKDATGKEAAQKWQIVYNTGAVKAIE